MYSNSIIRLSLVLMTKLGVPMVRRPTDGMALTRALNRYSASLQGRLLAILTAISRGMSIAVYIVIELFSIQFSWKKHSGRLLCIRAPVVPPFQQVGCIEDIKVRQYHSVGHHYVLRISVVDDVVHVPVVIEVD